MYFLPPDYQKMPLTHKIAYAAVMSALAVIVNIFSVDLVGGMFKLSFVSTICLLSGILFGPFMGFVIGFLGDGLAFLISPSPFAYNPLFGISNGLVAFIAGFVFMFKKHRGLFVKVIISAVISYFVCTLIVSSVGVYIIFNVKTTFFAYIIKRIIFQTPVNIVNAFASYYLIKALLKVKLMRFNLS